MLAFDQPFGVIYIDRAGLGIPFLPSRGQCPNTKTRRAARAAVRRRSVRQRTCAELDVSRCPEHTSTKPMPIRVSNMNKKKSQKHFVNRHKFHLLFGSDFFFSPTRKTTATVVGQSQAVETTGAESSAKGRSKSAEASLRSVSSKSS